MKSCNLCTHACVFSLRDFVVIKVTTVMFFPSCCIFSIFPLPCSVSSLVSYWAKKKMTSTCIVSLAAIEQLSKILNK